MPTRRTLYVAPVAGYDANFYDSAATALGRTSAAVVTELALTYVQPGSVVDVGCGNGAWTKAFADRGAERYLGVDGPWIDPQWLDIPAEHFRPVALGAGATLEGDYDLAISVEVGEHLPEAAAEGFVDTLTGLAPVVLFSAAIPFQGGTGHLNEQWPSWWKAKFAARGYVAVDALRTTLWDRDDVAYYYAQNLAFYVRGDALGDYPALQVVHTHTGGALPDLVHPEIWERRSRQPINVPRIVGRERAERLRDGVNNLRRRRTRAA